MARTPNVWLEAEELRYLLARWQSRQPVLGGDPQMFETIEGRLGRKDDPRESPTSPMSPPSTVKPPTAPVAPSVPTLLPVPGTPPTPSDYRSILIRNRKTQLAHIAENIQRINRSYGRALDVILERVRALPDGVARTGTGWLGAQLEMMASVRTEMETWRREYGEQVDFSMIMSAQDAADREAEVAQLVGAPADGRLNPSISKTITSALEGEVSISFGTLARDAVETVANRYYRDGLKLSDRLYKLTTETRKLVEDTIVSGIASGQSARNLAKEIQRVMAQEGVQTPLYNARRIARTEVTNAFRESHARSTMTPSGELKPYLNGVRFSLSLSHPAPDVCDLYATHDEGKGPGIYEPGEVPVSHPHCLCNTTSVLVYFPEVGMNGKKPDVDAVPESQIAYYAAQGDKPAAAALAARGA